MEARLREWVCHALGLLLVLAPPAATAAALPVFVSIPPQAFLLERLGGVRVNVQTLLGPGANPHNYDPSARQLVALAGARVYFTVGIPFEDMWHERLQSVSPELRFVRCDGDIPHAGHDHHGESDHLDPHAWTSPVTAQAIARCMHTTLRHLDPTGAAVYDRNLRNLLEELQALHAEIRRTLAGVAKRYLLVQHPGWGHFADEYGFEQIAIENRGHEPNARHLVRVIERARVLDLDTVFVQRRYRLAAARLVAEALGARIVEADPMAADYPAMLRGLARALAGR